MGVTRVGLTPLHSRGATCTPNTSWRLRLEHTARPCYLRLQFSDFVSQLCCLGHLFKGSFLGIDLSIFPTWSRRWFLFGKDTE